MSRCKLLPYYCSMVRSTNWLKLSKSRQWLLSMGLVLCISLAFYLAGNVVGYRMVSFGLLTTVALLALLVDIGQVLTAALLSALIWNFFFIPPVFTFHISNAEDMFMFLSFFIVASVHAVLTRKIKRAQAKAAEIEKNELLLAMYDTFLNSLSHELKTPIAAVIGTSDVLMNSFNQLSAADQLALVHDIQRAGIRLESQVENILTMSRIESKAFVLNLEYYDLNESVHQLIQLECTEEQLPRVKLQIAEDFPLVKMDLRLFQHALQNLLRNALSYTQGDICIKGFHRDNELIILVEDHGNGIAEEYQARLFGKFYRLPNTSPGGSGLGLSIVKGFAKLHGGDVLLLASNEMGTVFQLTLKVEFSFIKNLNHD